MAEIHPPLEEEGPLWMQAMMRVVGSQLEGIDNSCDAVAWVLREASVQPPDNADDLASWAQWGYDIKSPEYGCVIVLPDRVGLCQRQEGKEIYLASVHVSDGPVSIIAFGEDEIIACRWPKPEDFNTGYYPDDDRK